MFFSKRKEKKMTEERGSGKTLRSTLVKRKKPLEPSGEATPA